MSHYRDIDRYREEILTGNVIRVLFKLGSPLMLVNIVMLLYNLADAYWLSRYSEYLLSVPRQAWPVLMLLNAFIMAYSAANMAIISQYVGARVYDKASRTVSNLFTLNIAYGLAAYTLLTLLSPLIFTAVVRTPPEILSNTVLYARIMAFEILLASIAFTLSTFMQSIGDTRTPARIQMA